MTLFGLFDKVPGLDAQDSTANLGRRWGWLLAVGIIYIPLGIIALMMPAASTLGITVALGALLIVSGIVQMVHAYRLRHDQGGVMRILRSLLSMAIGAMILWMPMAGMLGVAILLCFYFFVGAAVQWTHASVMAPKNIQTWEYLSACASFILGAYIIISFPMSALRVPGVLLGLEFIILGINYIGFAFAARKLHHLKHPTDSHAPTGGFKPSGQYS